MQIIGHKSKYMHHVTYINDEGVNNISALIELQAQLQVFKYSISST